MTYFWIFLLQIVLHVAVIIYIRWYCNQQKYKRETQKEIENLIISFNEYAHRNIALLDDKVAFVKDFLKEVETKISRQKKTLFFHQKSNPKMRSVPTQPKNLPDKKLKKPRKKALTAQNTYEAIHGTQPKNDNLKTYFDRQEVLAFEKMTLIDKLRFYKEKQMPNDMIAKKLDLSIDEVNLMWHSSRTKKA